jgi:site-specific DNA-methyltransferase (adenine-specific)
MEDFYYENSGLLFGDCLERMRGIQSDTIDAVVCDPPYCSGSVSEASRTAAKGQGLRSEVIQKLGWFVGDNMGTAGLAFLLRSVALEGMRVLKPSGSLLMFCDWRMVPNLIPAIESAGFRYQNLIVWDKGGMGLGKGFRAQHELVMHMTCGKPEYHDKSTSNVIRVKRVNHKKRVHQTEKPVGLLEKLINVVSCEGGIILDPFMGSGSTGEACINTDRDFIGIERGEENFQIAKDRILKKIIKNKFDTPNTF